MSNESKCKHCGRLMRFILGASGNYIPVDRGAVRVDGRRQLVFNDGTVGRVHARFQYGFVAHPATCLGVKRTPARRQVLSRQPRLMDVSGCPRGCANGWIRIEQAGKSGVKPCPIHRA